MKEENRNNTNGPSSPLRRKTLKTLAAGVGALAGSTVMPDRWITPVIQGIALPAHAQTSVPGIFSRPPELTLVDGHSGTDTMTVEATGYLASVYKNTELELTLEGYDAADAAAITQDDKSSGFASTTFLPSAHAAPVPLCFVKLKVKTDNNGKFKAIFKLKCGKGIVLVILKCFFFGQLFQNVGQLDIPDCNPCSDDDKGSKGSKKGSKG
ncbi:MAG: hypothetical protein D3904_05470 [Candidatus Electrothrix sp. EH2]|nr:hypothetical protein [Candidatus Electrothrix sp. EH2]